MRRTFSNLKKTVFKHREPELPGGSASDKRLVFTRLYDHYAALMLGIIIQIVPDKTAATAILEQSFVAVYQQLDELTTCRQPLFVYLLKIARHTASDALAKRRLPNVAPLHLTSTGRLSKDSPPKNNRSTTGLMPKDYTDPQPLLNDVLFNNCTLEEAAATAGISADQARQQLRVVVQQLRHLSPRK